MLSQALRPERRGEFSLQPLIHTALALLLLSAIPVDGRCSDEVRAAVLPLLHGNEGDEQALELVRLLRETLGPRALSASEMRSLLTGAEPGVISPGRKEQIRQEFERYFVKTYSFAYKEAIKGLRDLGKRIDKLPPCSLRWEMFVKIHITLGMAWDGAKDKPAALRSFATVLRTRPDMALKRREYSSRIIRLWDTARQRLDALPRGSLAIDSQPGKAKIILDGVEVGETPFVGAYSRGRYHLQLLQADGSSAERWVEVGDKPTRINWRLLHEPSLQMNAEGPILKLRQGQSGLPIRWWEWLGRKLKNTRLVLVDRRCPKTGCEYMLRLLDPVSGQTKRYARVRRVSSVHLEPTARALASYLMDGNTSELLEPQGEQPADEPEAGGLLHRGQGRLVPALPTLEPFADIQPLYLRWWPWAIGSAGLLALSVGAHFAQHKYTQAAENALTVQGRDDNRMLADFSLGLAITGYCLSAASLITGLVLDFTFESPGQGLMIGPQGSQGMGIIWTGRF